jgi:hypothetical protein
MQKKKKVLCCDKARVCKREKKVQKGECLPMQPLLHKKNNAIVTAELLTGLWKDKNHTIPN